MSLVRWIRRNNRKIMVFVVIFCMVSFVIGYTGLQIIAGIFHPSRQVLATYGDGQKLRRMDLGTAQNELTVLRMLMAEQILASQGISGALTAYLLFPDSQIVGEIPNQLKQAVQRGQIQISMTELEAYFNQPTPLPEVTWTLLKAEAYRTGFIVSTEQAAQYLRLYIPQMMQVDARVLVQQIMNRSNLTEEQIKRIFADMLTIVNYANAVMDDEAVTLSQIKGFLGRTEESIDAEFARIDAETFVNEDTDVSQEAVQEQFAAFRENVPMMPTEENPYGFGYKLPKRVQVEYMAVEMDEVKEQVEQPTPEAMEEYYRNNIQSFQRSIPVDPNDPQSERIQQSRPYAEVEARIRTMLLNEKADNLANMIFNTVKDRTEAGFMEITFEEATVEQLQMAAGDYQAVAQEVSAEYNVPIVTGKTGWLSPSNLSGDEVLRSLSLPYQQTRIPLSQLLPTVSADPQQQTRRIGMPNIRLWQNIGPIKGSYITSEGDFYQTTVLLRVTDVKEAEVPSDIDVEYSTQGVVLFGQDEQEESVFSLKEDVKEDVLIKNAMLTAEARAIELAEAAEEAGWDMAIEEYNDKYAPGWDPNDPAEDTQAVELIQVQQQTRASQSEIIFVRHYIQDNPSRAEAMKRSLIMDTLNNKLYAMLPDDAESTGTISEVLLFDPLAACYVVKNITRQPPTTADYLENKAQAGRQLSNQDMAALALVHFNPENIQERMDYEPKETPREQPAEEEQASTQSTDQQNEEQESE